MLTFKAHTSGEAKQAGMERVHSRLSHGRNPVLLVLNLAY